MQNSITSVFKKTLFFILLVVFACRTTDSITGNNNFIPSGIEQTKTELGGDARRPHGEIPSFGVRGEQDVAEIPCPVLARCAQVAGEKWGRSIGPRIGGAALGQVGTGQDRLCGKGAEKNREYDCLGCAEAGEWATHHAEKVQTDGPIS